MAVPALTLEQAREYLASQGVTMPAIVLQALLDSVNSIDPCLEGAGYPEGTATLIKLYLLGLLGVVGQGRAVTSERAPSGAARSYQFGQLRDRYRGLLGLLRGLDLSGCTDGLIPPEPGTRSAAIFVGSPGCCHE